MEPHSTQCVASDSDEIQFQRPRMNSKRNKTNHLPLDIMYKRCFLFIDNLTFNRIVCKLQNQRYKTNSVLDIRLEEWMREKWAEKKKPNWMMKITAITRTTTITRSVVIIRQLEIFSPLSNTRCEKKRRENVQFRCLQSKINWNSLISSKWNIGFNGFTAQLCTAQTRKHTQREEENS